jgi:hypothetical protein
MQLRWLAPKSLSSHFFIVIVVIVIVIVIVIVKLVQRTSPLATLNGPCEFLKLFVALLCMITFKAAALFSTQELEVVSIVRKFSRALAGLARNPSPGEVAVRFFFPFVPQVACP